MSSAIAKLNNYRQSPRKVRLVADSIKGKKANEALLNLDFTVKRASSPISKLLSSAIANAKNLGLDIDKLVVSKIEVNSGKILYRRMPVSRGSAHPIRKRTSHITIILEEKEPKKAKVKISKEDKK